MGACAAVGASQEDLVGDGVLPHVLIAKGADEIGRRSGDGELGERARLRGHSIHVFWPAWRVREEKS